MSRASCVYVAIDARTYRPVAGFTVKYEMVDWWHKYSDGFRGMLVIYRLPGKIHAYDPPSVPGRIPGEAVPHEYSETELQEEWEKDNEA